MTGNLLNTPHGMYQTPNLVNQNYLSPSPSPALSLSAPWRRRELDKWIELRSNHDDNLSRPGISRSHVASDDSSGSESECERASRNFANTPWFVNRRRKHRLTLSRGVSIFESQSAEGWHAIKFPTIRFESQMPELNLIYENERKIKSNLERLNLKINRIWDKAYCYWIT